MKRNRTKKSLLLSVMSLLLCVSMFASSTYAWFTDEVSSGVNQIIAGNLDVELYHNTLEDGVFAASDTKVTGDTTDLFHAAADNVAVLWEPGAMAVEKFTVKNVGNLALKYKLSFNDLVEGFYNYVTWGNGTTQYDLTDVIKVAVSDTAITSRDASLNFVSWDAFVTAGAKVGKLAADAEESFYVALYWAPNDNAVDNLYNLKIGAFDTTTNPNGYVLHGTTAAATVTNAPTLSTVALELYPTITLVATQDTVESDSFDNQYDVNADGVNSYTVSKYQPVDTTQATTLVVNGTNGVEAEATISTDLATTLGAQGVTSTALVLENRSEATTEDTVEISYQNVDLVDQDGKSIDLTTLDKDIPVKFNIGAGLGVGAKIDVILDQGTANEQKFSTVTKTGYGAATYDNATGELSFTAKHFCPLKVEFEKPEAFNETTNTYYATLRGALDAADSNATIKVLKDVDLGDRYNLTKTVTIDGDGYQVRSSKETGGYGASKEGRVFDFDETANDITVTLKNLSIKGEDNAVRGISAYGSSNVKLIINNCDIWANYYAINVASNNTNFELEAVNSTYSTGWCAVQSWSANAKFTFTNCTLKGINDKSYNSEGWNNFGTVVINGAASNNTFTFDNCRLEAKQTTGNKQWIFSFRADNTTINMNNNSVVYKDDVKLNDNDLITLYANGAASFTTQSAINTLKYYQDGALVFPEAD